MRIVTLVLLAALPIARVVGAGSGPPEPPPAAPRLWLIPAVAPAPGPPVQVLGFVHPGSWLVEAPAAALSGRAAVPFADRRKVAAGLSRRLKRSHPGDQALELVLHPRAAPDHLAATLAKLAPEVRVFDRRPGPPRRLLLRVPGSRLGAVVELLQARPEVMWLDRYQPAVWLNVASVGPIQANADSGGDPPTATPIWDQGLIGSGQIIGIADSGLDRNEAWFRQYYNGSVLNGQITAAEAPVPPTIGALFPARKVVAYWVMPGASPYDDNQSCGLVATSFHGTHVTGTAAGDSGVASRPDNPNYDTGDGMAPQARILFQDLGDDQTGCLTGAGGAPMWAQARAGGALIHSNSYGAPAAGGYVASDQEVDDFLWRNEDMLIVFAAGNSGAATMTINHPGNAKHVLTVGALNHGTSTVPAGFSSRGPTPDGRIKPDLVAPGVGIVSARGNDLDATITAPQTLVLSGTSMATPAVAGGAALARQYFIDGFYPTGTANPADGFNPSGALLKAVLVNGTRTYPGTPETATGWGRIWLDSNLYFIGDDRALRVWALPNAAGLSTTESHQYSVQVTAGEEFRATLVWYDPAPSLASPAALVNDLDLVVTTPSATLLGNAFAAGESVSGGAGDRINPVEQVRLTAPEAGTYLVDVHAVTVPGNGQPQSDRQGYALVVSGGHCATNVAAAPDFTLSTDAGGVSIDVTAMVAGATSYQFYRAEGGCAVDRAEFDFAGARPGLMLLDATTQGGFRYGYRVRATDGCGEGPVSVCREIVSQAPCTLVPEFSAAAPAKFPLGDFCAVELSWDPATARCPPAGGVGYEVHRSQDPFFSPEPATLLGAGLAAPRYTDYQAPPGVTHYYRVVASDDLGNAAPATAAVAFPAVAYPAEASGPALGTFSDGGEALALARLEPPWRLTEQAAAEGARSYRNAPDGLNYPAETCAALTTPAIPLAAGAVLSYQARFELESNWDGVVVEISADGGSSWTDLPPAGGYPGDFAQTGSPPANACGYPASRGAFNGSSGGIFQTHQSDLAAWAGQTVRIRWRFSSDSGVEEDGFYLDSIEITNAGMPLACLPGELVFASGYER